MDVDIRKGRIADIGPLLAAVPELEQRFDPDDAARRLQHQGLVLIADVGAEPAGFKVGYDRFADGSYYSWLGGVLPRYRGRNVAQALLERQEDWVRNHGYRGIYVKTRNRFVAMRLLLARNGYNLVGMEAQPDQLENRLLHYKAL